MSTPIPKYVIHNTRVHTLFTHNGLSGYRPEDATLPVLEKLPTVVWKEARIPVALWREVLAFFKWSYDTTKSETQVRLFYNFATKEWRAHAFPQEHGSGMTTCEIENHPNRDEDMELFKGFRAWGTVHHHCSMGAFQSGTDRADEEGQAGLHITVGHMDKAEYDLHSRVSVILPGELNEKGDAIVRPAQKMFLEPNLIDWFALEEGAAKAIPSCLHPIVLKHYLTSGVKPEETFPKRWADNVIEVKRTPVNGPHSQLSLAAHRGLITGGEGLSPYEQAIWSEAQLARRKPDGKQPAIYIGGRKHREFSDAELCESWDHYMGDVPNPHQQ